jgi:hypothetical protein
VIALVSGILTIQDVARLPTAILFLVGALTAAISGWSVIVDQRREIAALTERLVSDDRKDEALTALNERIEEGNHLSRELRRYRIPEGATRESVNLDADAQQQAVAEWNERCRETARHHAPYLAGALDKPLTRERRDIPYATPSLRLQDEVAIKIERLQEMQALLVRR